MGNFAEKDRKQLDDKRHIWLINNQILCLVIPDNISHYRSKSFLDPIVSFAVLLYEFKFSFSRPGTYERTFMRSEAVSTLLDAPAELSKRPHYFICFDSPRVEIECLLRTAYLTFRARRLTEAEPLNGARLGYR